MFLAIGGGMLLITAVFYVLHLQWYLEFGQTVGLLFVSLVSYCGAMIGDVKNMDKGLKLMMVLGFVLIFGLLGGTQLIK